jgi:O-antigen ligase
LRDSLTQKVLLHRYRLALLVCFVSLPIIAVWPPDVFDAFFGIKAALLIALGLGTAGWWVLVGVSPTHPALRMSPFAVVWVMLVCWLTLATVLSVDSAGAVWGSPGREDGLLVWLAGLSILAVASTEPGERDWRLVSTVLVTTAFVVSIFAVAQRFGFDPLSSGAAAARGRSSSTLRNPVFLGGYLALVAPICVAWCARIRAGRWKAVGAIALGLTFAALYFTFSRAAWLGALGGIVLLIAWAVWRHRRITDVMVVVVIALAIAVTLSVLPHPQTATTETHSLGQDAPTIVDVGSSRNAGRIAIWEIALRMIGDRPWFGVGLDQMGTVFEGYRTARYDAAEGARTYADRAHSDPLHLAVTCGIPAALLFYVLVGIALWRSRRRWLDRSEDAFMWAAVTVGVLGYLAQSLVSVTVPGVHTLFLVLLGALAARSDPLHAPIALHARVRGAA